LVTPNGGFSFRDLPKVPKKISGSGYVGRICPDAFQFESPSVVDWQRWKDEVSTMPGIEAAEACRAKATQITKAFWTNGGGLPEKWLQTGLALSPLVGT